MSKLKTLIKSVFVLLIMGGALTISNPTLAILFENIEKDKILSDNPVFENHTAMVLATQVLMILGYAASFIALLIVIAFNLGDLARKLFSGQYTVIRKPYPSYI